MRIVRVIAILAVAACGAILAGCGDDGQYSGPTAVGAAPASRDYAAQDESFIDKIFDDGGAPSQSGYQSSGVLNTLSASYGTTPETSLDSLADDEDPFDAIQASLDEEQASPISAAAIDPDLDPDMDMVDDDIDAELDTPTLGGGSTFDEDEDSLLEDPLLDDTYGDF